MADSTSDYSWFANVSKPQIPAERVERRDAREHRQLILAVAHRLFAEHGIDAVSMHQIAVAAGIGQGTLYRRYRHKSEICMDLLQEQHRQFVEEIMEFFDAMKAVPALQRLKGLLKLVIDFLEDQGTLLGPTTWLEHKAMAEHRTHCGEGAASGQQMPAYPAFFSWLQELFIGLFTEAVARKELPPLDVFYTTQTLLFNLAPSFYLIQREKYHFSAERILQGLYHIYIDGLRAE